MQSDVSPNLSLRQLHISNSVLLPLCINPQTELAESVVAAWAGDRPPDFQLMDANPNSMRYNTPVSPRDYISQVSGYYFANAG